MVLVLPCRSLEVHISTLLRCVAVLVLFSLLPSARLASAQGKPSTTSPTPSNFPAEYPNDGASVLVGNSRWVDLSDQASFSANLGWECLGKIYPSGISDEHTGTIVRVFRREV